MRLPVRNMVSLLVVAAMLTPVAASAQAVAPSARPLSAAEAALSANRPGPPMTNGALPPAAAAGVRQAQAVGLDEIPWVFIGGGILVLTAVVLGLMHDEGSTSATSTN